MFAVLTSAFGFLVRWLLGAGTIKWVFAAVVGFGLAGLVDLLLSLFPAWLDGTELGSRMGSFTPGVWYFLDYFDLQGGLSLLASAYVARFLIRRIPFFG